MSDELRGRGEELVRAASRAAEWPPTPEPDRREEDAFLAHVRAVAAEVKTWPRWKQLVFG